MVLLNVLAVLSIERLFGSDIVKYPLYICVTDNIPLTKYHVRCTYHYIIYCTL